MKTRITTLVVVLFALWLQPLGAQQPQYLTILHLNDTHSNLLPGTPRDITLAGQRGGIARAATVIGQTAAEETPWMLLHAGDAAVGDLMHFFPFNGTPAAFPDLQILAGLGLSAMTLGNHEFDFGPAALESALGTTFAQGQSVSLLCANGDFSAMSGLAAMVEPSVIKDFGAFKVGIIGMTTPATNYLSMPAPVTFEEDPGVLGYTLGTTAAALRDAGCNYVIFLSHMGMKADKMLAAAVPGIDLIIGGHDHIATHVPVRVTNPYGKVVSIVQTEGFYTQIGSIRLKLHNGIVTLNKYDLIDLDYKVAENQDVKDIVDGIATDIEDYLAYMSAPFIPMFSQAIATCSTVQTELATNLGRPGYHDTHVGNLVADIYQDNLGVDIGLIPGGSTAQPLFPGYITANDVFRMLGYGMNEYDYIGYEVVTFSLSGEDLCKGLEFTLSDIETDDEYFMQVSSNLQYYYDPSKPAGSRLQAVYFNGAPIDMEEEYTIGTNYMVYYFLEMMNQEGLGITILNPVPQQFGEFGFVLSSLIGQQLGGHRTPGRIVAVAPMTAMNNTTPPPMAKIVSAGPNPFFDNTSVLVETSEDAPLQVKVYDVMGREVATLMDGYSSAGQYNAVFEAHTLPAGLYFCRLFMADGQVQTLKIVKSR